MTPYIATNPSRPCRAKDPSNCRYHGTGEYSAPAVAPFPSARQPTMRSATDVWEQGEDGEEGLDFEDALAKAASQYETGIFSWQRSEAWKRVFDLPPVDGWVPSVDASRSADGKVEIDIHWQLTEESAGGCDGEWADLEANVLPDLLRSGVLPHALEPRHVEDWLSWANSFGKPLTDHEDQLFEVIARQVYGVAEDEWVDWEAQEIKENVVVRQAYDSEVFTFDAVADFYRKHIQSFYGDVYG